MIVNYYSTRSCWSQFFLECYLGWQKLNQKEVVPFKKYSWNCEKSFYQVQSAVDFLHQGKVSSGTGDDVTVHGQAVADLVSEEVDHALKNHKLNFVQNGKL